jgi:hydroxylamine dehydrogenase
MKTRIAGLFIFFLFMFAAVFSGIVRGEENLVPLSEETEECLDCHNAITPGIVQDWQSSEHAQGTPEASLSKPALEREVSNTQVPEGLKQVAVGCYECHSLNSSDHKDSFDHFDRRISVVVSPKDCATCHSEEEKQYASSKKANALHNLQENPVYHALVETITSVKDVEDSRISMLESSDTAKADSCYACHGTHIEFQGMITMTADVGDVEIPKLSHWPNQGVGRINPDGSRGACTSCHPRHSFSIEIARKPDTCSQCHLEPDVPAWNVYRESKHGNIYHSLGNGWNWKEIPWEVGRDFKAPTCAACHVSLITDPEGEVVAPRSHDFGGRLWVRLFGLIYAHPQPKSGQTYLIKNKDGLPLPTAFTGEPASEFLLDEKQQKTRQQTMRSICGACHSTPWVNGHFDRLDATINEADRMVLAATKLLLEAWDLGLAEKANPFDEAIELKWIKQWLFYANSLRYASAMSGQDYAAFKNGWFELTKNLQDMAQFIQMKQKK